MPLLKHGRVIEDAWLALADEGPAPDGGAISVSLARWQAERENWIGRNALLGVRLKNTDPVATLAPDLGRLALIALEFPKFDDGRAYSQARLLRERLGYGGEVRATGEVLLDQLLFMERSGFDAFELASADAAAAWRQAQSAFEVFYQPATDGRAVISDLRRRLLEPARRP